MTWRVFAATAIGKSHIDGGLPCQDAVAHRRVGDVLIAVVCDGAGSCALSDVGAAAVTQDVVALLAARAEAGALSPAMAIGLIFEAVAEAVAAVRARLDAEAIAHGTTFSDYSATMVGVIANGDGGCFFHIGDGLGIAQGAATDAVPVISTPENGEYANETYFITGEFWLDHLRLTRFSMPATTIALMSDGAMPFVMAKNHAGFHRPFIEPVTRYLATVPDDDGSLALGGTLADPRTYLITGDDKALLIALWQ
jgi:hypothetical protein